MHMSDALVSPEVGITCIAVAAAVVVYHGRKLEKQENIIQKLPLMSILGAFVFVAQMINFSIPGTGSSGHIAGSLLMAVILGPSAAIVIISSILLIQALLFGDGGILALGTNIINMGVIPCFIIYPFVWQQIVNKNLTKKKILIASCVGGMLAMATGALAVVVETYISGIAKIPFAEFILLMVPIHLLIGLGEGLITSGVVWFAFRRKMIQNEDIATNRINKSVLISATIGLIIPVILLTWFASANPDGLEWSLGRSSAELVAEENPGTVHQLTKEIQEKTSVLPDYTLSNHLETQQQQKMDYMLVAFIGSLIMVAFLSLISGGIYLLRRRKV